MGLVREKIINLSSDGNIKKDFVIQSLHLFKCNAKMIVIAQQKIEEK